MHPLKKHCLVFTVFALIAGLTAGCSAEARKARHRADGDKFFDAGQYPRAEIEYLNVLKADPLDPHAFGRLGLIYFDQGRAAKAYSYLMKACELDPTNAAVHIKAGYLRLNEGKADLARAEAVGILEREPRNEDAPQLLAQSARTRIDVANVRQVLENSLKLYSNSAPLNVGLGTILLRSGELKAAEASFRHAIELAPRYAQAHYSLGIVYWAQGQLTNADLELKTAAELSPPRSPRRLDYADFKLKTGQPDAARRLLTQATTDAPDCLSAWNSLAQVTLALKQYDECEAAIKRALALEPANFDTLMLDCNLRLSKGEVDKAITELEHMNSLFEHSPQTRYALALAYLARGDADKAAKSVSDSIALDPNYDEALLLQAQLNIRRNNAGAAITSLTQLIQRRPQLVPAYLLLGSAYTSKGNFDDALAVFQDLFRLNPTNAQVPLLIGNVYVQQKKTDEARKAFEKSFELAPGNLPALEQLVTLDLMATQYVAAIGRVQAEVTKHPESPELQMLLAQIFILEKDQDQAEKALEKAISLNPDYQPAYLRLAELYRVSNRNDQALERLHQVIARNPKEVRALLLIGMLQNEQKRYAEARATYEKLLAINPDFGLALNNLAYLYSEKFDMLPKAYETASRARELLPGDPATADTLGWILFKRGEYTWALSLLQESAEKLTNNPELLFHLGMTCYMLNDEARASNVLTRALSFNEDFTGKAEATSCLALLALDPKTAAPDATAALEARLLEKPDDPIALSRLAAIYDHQGAPEQAVKVYEQALKQNQKNARLLIDLARLYADRLHQPEKALSLAKDAYKLAPDNADAAYILGRLAVAGGDGKRGLSLLQQAAQRQTPRPEQLFDLATAYYSVGRVKEAETTMRAALQADDSFAHAAQARQFLDLIALPDTPDKAVAALPQVKQILQEDPANVPALMVLAAASQQQNDAAAATRACEEALKRYPDFVPAIKRLAILYADKPGDDKKAYELALKARESLPDDPELARALGMVLFRRGDFRGAAIMLNETCRRENADGTSWYYLGMSQYHLKQLKESKDALERALALNVPDPLAGESRRVLAELK